MIDFAKDFLLVTASKKIRSFPDYKQESENSTTTKKLLSPEKKQELNDIYYKLLEIESNFYSIESNEKYDKSKTEALKNRILNIKNRVEEIKNI